MPVSYRCLPLRSLTISNYWLPNHVIKITSYTYDYESVTVSYLGYLVPSSSSQRFCQSTCLLVPFLLSQDDSNLSNLSYFAFSLFCYPIILYFLLKTIHFTVIRTLKINHINIISMNEVTNASWLILRNSLLVKTGKRKSNDVIEKNKRIT